MEATEQSKDSKLVVQQFRNYGVAIINFTQKRELSLGKQALTTSFDQPGKSALQA